MTTDLLSSGNNEGANLPENMNFTSNLENTDANLEEMNL